ncbi:GNAT family N-acetyltransferase [Cryobacterium sp. PAMC25264]|uniref:GNAT family N-acetyltransferase n=1 Tax=Cryobacterium sp. PAMC25264 TaxID=2861288 RepID=UPI001C62D829|nr:GNAT family N-acetyltransferase [Cryobacterium sp. PAMC25264]QYF73801.1 GNAT family N-acetyltransferase [Cryobacterium sp. PAMC25264]
MRPVELSSPLLCLDAPRPADAALVFEYCQDPVMARYLARLPSPYRLEDATDFVTDYVPDAWAGDQEYTWAVRGEVGSELLGVISLSVPVGSAEAAAEPSVGSGSASGSDSQSGFASRTSSIGFWLGAAHRGRGLMVEAQRLVLEWGFSTGLCDTVHWECVAGNLASARAARKAGFRFTGQGPAGIAYRDGTHPPSWKGALHATDDRTPPAGWPAEVVAA